MDKLPSWVTYTHSHNQHSLLQREYDLDKLMVKLGHPCAQEYLRVRALFDRLNYFSSASCRFYTFIDTENFSSIAAPRLRITDPGFERLTQTAVQCHAMSGWPRKDCYQLDYGSWQTRTNDPVFMEKLQEVLNDDPAFPNGKSYTIDSVEIHLKDTYEALCRLADQYQGRLIALLRQPDPAMLVERIRERTITLSPMLRGPDAWL